MINPSTSSTADATQAALKAQMDQFAQISAEQTIQQAQNVVKQRAVDIVTEQAANMGKGKDKISY